MGGKGKGSSNNAVVQEQQRQADEVRQKEDLRQARLTEGKAKIKAAFEGSPVMGTRQVAKTREIAGTPAQPAAEGFYLDSGQYLPGTEAVAGAAPGTETYYEDETYDTGQKTAGFDDAFYDKYGQAVSDYYMPQVEKQYADAGKELTYRLSRSGNLRSKAAADETADLSTQYDLNKANVKTKADTAETGLRDTVSSQRNKIETALQASEDPTQASDQALAAVRDISLQQPDLSPLGAIFNLATIGGANFLKGSRNAQYANAFDESNKPKVTYVS